MKISFIYLSILIGSIVKADVDLFTKPPTEIKVPAGRTIGLQVSQLPDIDGQPIYANVYAEGTDVKVMTIRSWSPSSVSDSQKNNFAFDWPVPSNLCPGSYYVKIDINNDQDDNDICRSRTIEILPNNLGQVGGHNTPSTSSNRPITQCGKNGPSSGPVDNHLAGKPASNGGVLRNSISGGSII